MPLHFGFAHMSGSDAPQSAIPPRQSQQVWPSNTQSQLVPSMHMSTFTIPLFAVVHGQASSGKAGGGGIGGGGGDCTMQQLSHETGHPSNSVSCLISWQDSPSKEEHRSVAPEVVVHQ